jgi:hypothetical protein
MASRPLLRSVVAVLCVVGTLAAQPPKARNPIEFSLKAARLESPEGGDPGKFGQMRNGNVDLEKPTADQLAILDVKARQLIFPVTHFEYYTATEAANAELTPRVEDKTVTKLVSDLRSQLVVITPGDSAIPAPKIHFARQFGAAAVRAIDEVLNKGPQPVVRMNAVRLLAVVAESGAPAATERVIALLRDKDKGLSVEALYYGLKAAEQAIAMYDPARSADAQKWVTKDTYFALVSLVDDIVQQVPASVALNTHQPDQAGTGLLTTDPKAPPKTAPTSLTAEQVATVQAFRLQAVRALARVKTDVVYDSKGEMKRRPAYTLARVAISDTTLVPAPSKREVIEAVGGLATAAPTDPEIDPLVLGIAMARGVLEFASDKAAGRVGESGQQFLHWRLTGARMKALFQAWDVTLGKSKLDKDGKALLRGFATDAVTHVFEPMSKQTDAGVVTGLNTGAIEEWLTKRQPEVKAMQLFKDTDRPKGGDTSKLNPR